MVILRAKRCRPVSIMPFTSSPSRKVRKKSRMRVMAILRSPRPKRCLHPDADHHDPYERDRNEHFPAEPHDLVVAVARECGAEPDEARYHQENLEEEPPGARR